MTARSPDPPDAPPPWQAWIARQSAQRLALLDEIVDERIARRALRAFLCRLKHAVVAAFLGAAAVAHWFSDQAAWIAERLPALRLLWRLVTGGH
ncbi:hypothetical protein [Methylobacterium sp. SD21]|uniref:hypothetical protein n=1 Tax=Methylobacterium litchii TaxID=3138810 RepID=UPI00313CF3E9